jgi:glycosyltransferase involved in cell wall biosynthesis
MPHRGDTPTVVTVHDLTFFTNPEWHESAKVAFFTRAIRYAAHHAAAIICVSELTRRMLQEFVAPSVPVVVAPHGVDLARFTPHDADDERRLAEVGIEGPYVAFVGTLEPRKGLDVVLDAFATLAATMPELRLVVVGQRGWGMGPIETALATHPAAERIIQPGYLADSLLPAFLRHARAVVYPSRGEGFGLPVLEALACGAPVVTTRGTVMEEVAGGAARLVPIGDATATAAALRELIDLDDGARMAIGDLGRARASEFTWERSIERHLEAYALASGRPA